MQRARDIHDYLANPIGRYAAGEGFLHFFFDAALCGTVFWGEPGEEAIKSLIQILVAELPQYSGVHAALVDARRLTGIDPVAFQMLSRFSGEHAVAFASNISRQAMVRPAGVVGAVVAGFYDVTPSACPERTRICEDITSAFEWLGRSDGACICEALDEIDSQLRAVSPILEALRTYLSANPRRVSLTAAARHLGVSTRQLQQKLTEANTTFRNEVSAARVATAKHLLMTTDTKLTVVALEVGCASLQHFSLMFRKATGEQPSQWRARRRGATQGGEPHSLHDRT